MNETWYKNSKFHRYNTEDGARPWR